MRPLRPPRPLRALALAVGLALTGGGALAAPQDRRISDAGPEAALQQILAEIEAKRLDAALDRVDTLLAVYPNFRLAQLIKGDLLLAHSQPLSGFGGTPGPQKEIDDLREEAIARLRAYRERPESGYVPRYLLQMAPEEEHAVVVDTRRARLYVYRNDNGRPRLVADYYASHGKAGAAKMYEGDNKTPLGVYHVTSFISPAKLPDFYGSGAFPLNYPNEWDKRHGRTGYGIWLHGTPSDTYARPPKSSEGCVVLSNQDLITLADYVQPGQTPVIISNEVEWLAADDWQAQRQSLGETIEAWRRDWESGDVDRHLSHYSPRFSTGSVDYAALSAQKRRVAARREWVKVGVDRISMYRNPGQEELVVVTFEQDYRSNTVSDKMRKRQYWTLENGRWKIIFEGAAT